MQIVFKLTSLLVASISAVCFSPLNGSTTSDAPVKCPATAALIEVTGTPAAPTLDLALLPIEDDCGDIVKVSRRRVYGPEYTCPPEPGTWNLTCPDGSIVEVPVMLVKTKVDWVDYILTDYEDCFNVESTDSGTDVLGENRRIVGGFRCPGGCLVTSIVTEWLPASPATFVDIQTYTTSITCPNDEAGTETSVVTTIYAEYVLIETSYCSDGSVHHSRQTDTLHYVLTSVDFRTTDCD